MSPDRGARAWYWAAAAGALLVAGWLAGLVLPVLHENMIDQVFSFLIITFVVVLLWWAARRAPEGDARRWWRLLSIGWTVNLAGNIIWGIYTTITSQTLPLTGLLDLLYLVRYAVLIAAFWRPKTVRLDLLPVAALPAAAIWLFLLRPALPGTEYSLWFLLGGMVYPILDAIIAYEFAVAALRCAPGKLRWALWLLAAGMLFYLVANWANLGVWALADENGAVPMIFWALTDVAAAAAGLVALWRGGPAGPVWSRQPRIEKRLPLAAVPLVTAMLVGDVALNHRWDVVLIVCTAIAVLSCGFILVQRKGGY